MANMYAEDYANKASIEHGANNPELRFKNEIVHYGFRSMRFIEEEL